MDEFDVELEDPTITTASQAPLPQASDDGVRYEVVMGGEAPPEESDPDAGSSDRAGVTASANSAAPNPSATSNFDAQQLATRLQQLESRLNGAPPATPARSLPNLEAMQQRLRSDDANVEDIVAYVQANNNVLAHYFDQRAASAAGAEKARGEFSPAVMGEGLDYDSMNARYIEPLLQQNPAVEQAIALAAPEDPARGRMVLAAMMKVLDETRGDPITGLKTILGRVDARAAGAKEVKAKITDAAKRRADRSLQPGARTAETRRLDAGAMQQASDAELIRLTEQLGHSI